ncbi:MAG: peptidoglycan DD-metalloendopeptidase family protein [Proteobacteria bacterium]|nr:peptidoglycan DD-metalloendopeptidase family protein [Pseudomonadota bacterium]
MPPIIKTIFKYAISGILLLILPCIYVQAADQTIPYGIVSTFFLNVRSGPGQSYPVIDQLTKGTRVDILEEDNKWLKIEYVGKKGFVRNRNQYIVVKHRPVQETLPDPQTHLTTFKESGIITANWIHVRTGPGTHYPSIGLLEKNTQVDILKNQGEWLNVSVNGDTGFIRNREIYIHISHNGSHILTENPSSAPPSQSKEKTPVIGPKIPEKSVQLKVNEISRKIEVHEEEIKNYSEKEHSIINGLNEIEISLNTVFKNATATRKKLNAIENKVGITEKNLADLKSLMTTDEEYVAKRLVSLYKLTNIGNMPILASSDSMYEFFTRKIALDRILSEDAKIFENHYKNMDSLIKLKKELEIQQKTMLSLKSDYDDKIRIISNKKEKRATLLSDIRNQKSLTVAAIDSLKQAQFDLEQKIQSRYREESNKPDPTPNNTNCTFIKGNMLPPVNGQVVTLFGQGIETDYNFKTFFNGIDIKTERGEPIQAVCGGFIIFSDWLKGYGNLIIIDHGNYYYTVYAHAEELFRKKGDYVEPGEVIATVGESGSVAEPKLYFEIRLHGKPIDPLTWLKKG